MNKPNYMTPNNNHNSTGGLDWSSAPGRKADYAEADAVRAKFGAGWHTESSLLRGGLSVDSLWALLRANFVRLDGWIPGAGPSGSDMSVYLIFF